MQTIYLFIYLFIYLLIEHELHVDKKQRQYNKVCKNTYSCLLKT